MNRYIDLLKKRRNYRYIWLASVVSFLGDWFNTIASVMIVNRYTDSGLALSYILIARTLPRFIVGPLAGVVADRFNRKHVMVISDLLRSAIVLSFLFVDRAERVWLIYVLTAAQFIIASFFEPSSSAIMPSLVKGEDEIVTANVLSSVTWSTMLALGAAIGGIFAGLFGASVALIIDSGTFILSAILVLQVKRPKITLVKDKPEDRSAGFMEGVRYLLNNSQVLGLSMVKLMGQVGSGDIIFAVYSERYFPYGEDGATALGIMFAAAGLGAFMGPLIARQLTDGSSRMLRRAIWFGYMAVPIGWTLVGWAPSLSVVVVGIIIRMIGASVNWTFSNVLIQLKVPNQYLGRIFSLDMALFTLTSSISIWLTGYFIDTSSLEPRRLVSVIAVLAIIPVFIWGGLQRLFKEEEGS